MEIDKEKIEHAIDIMNGLNLDSHESFFTSLSEAKKYLKALIEPEKWEPKAYPAWYSITQSGDIVLPAVLSDKTISYGNHWPIKKVAETARDMNERNQRILQAKTEIGAGDGMWEISAHKGSIQIIQTRYHANPEITFETSEQVMKVFEMVGLNVH